MVIFVFYEVQYMKYNLIMKLLFIIIIKTYNPIFIFIFLCIGLQIII